MSDVTISAAKEFGVLLSGKVAARQHFAKACQLFAGHESGELVIIDFKGVDYVSGSWINWMLVPLLAYTADDSNDYYVVLANFPALSLDDLLLIANAEHTPFIVLNDRPKKATVIGSLDPAQTATLKAVREHGDVTGAALADKNVKATAWNNRLRDLNLKRLLRRRKEGREQIYSLVIPEVQFDG
jgi:hypothetical protein